MESTPSRVGEVWHALNDELRTFLRSRLPNEADADDLLQDVFIRVLEKIGELREADRLTSWVYQVARNRINDFYRRQPPRPMDSVEEAIDNVQTVANHNEAVGAWLSVMVARLPDALRETVMTYAIETRPHAEIAHRFNNSLSGAALFRRRSQHVYCNSFTIQDLRSKFNVLATPIHCGVEDAKIQCSQNVRVRA